MFRTVMQENEIESKAVYALASYQAEADLQNYSIVLHQFQHLCY